MNIKLVLGNGETAFDFESEEDRDLWWSNMTEHHSWKPEWAEKIGSRTIRIHTDRMPYHWVWPLTDS